MPGRNRGNANLSDLDYLVLTSLIPEPLYGYAIIRRDILDRTEGFDEAQPGHHV